MRERALFALLKRPKRIRYRNNNRFQVQESLDNMDIIIIIIFSGLSARFLSTLDQHIKDLEDEIKTLEEDLSILETVDDLTYRKDKTNVEE